MENLKQSIKQEAASVALSLYEVNKEKEKLEKRMDELAIALSTIAAIPTGEEKDGSV